MIYHMDARRIDNDCHVLKTKIWKPRGNQAAENLNRGGLGAQYRWHDSCDALPRNHRPTHRFPGIHKNKVFEPCCARHSSSSSSYCKSLRLSALLALFSSPLSAMWLSTHSYSWFFNDLLFVPLNFCFGSFFFGSTSIRFGVLFSLFDFMLIASSALLSMGSRLQCT